MSVLNKKGFPFQLNTWGVCINPDRETLWEGKPKYMKYVKISMAYYDGSWKYGRNVQHATGGSSSGPWNGEYPTKKAARQAAIEYVLKGIEDWKDGITIRNKIIKSTSQHNLF